MDNRESVLSLSSGSEILTPLRRSSSNPTMIFPKKLSILLNHKKALTESASSGNLELLAMSPISQKYTSLRDILSPVSLSSPKWINRSPTEPGFDIGIRNRLVKHAAWAYLQPMSTTAIPEFGGGGFFRRALTRFSAFFDSVRRCFNPIFDWVFGSLWIRRYR